MNAQEEIFVASDGFDFTRTSPFRSPPSRRQGFYANPNTIRRSGAQSEYEYLPHFEKAEPDVTTPIINKEECEIPRPNVPATDADGSFTAQRTPRFVNECREASTRKTSARRPRIATPLPTFRHSTPAFWLNRTNADLGMSVEITPILEPKNLHKSRMTSSGDADSFHTAPRPHVTSSSIHRCGNSGATVERLRRRMDDVQRRMQDLERRNHFRTMMTNSDDSFFDDPLDVAMATAPRIRVVFATPPHGVVTREFSTTSKSHGNFTENSDADNDNNNETSAWSTHRTVTKLYPDGFGRIRIETVNRDRRSSRDVSTQAGSSKVTWAPKNPNVTITSFAECFQYRPW